MAQKLNYSGNLNYPDYGMRMQPSYQMSYPSNNPPQPPSAPSGPGIMSKAMPFLQGANVVSDVVSAGTGIYSAIKEAELAKKRYKLLMEQWERQKAQEDADRARELKRQQQQDAYSGAAQSSALEDRFASAYGGYRRGGQ